MNRTWAAELVRALPGWILAFASAVWRGLSAKIEDTRLGDYPYSDLTILCGERKASRPKEGLLAEFGPDITLRQIARQMLPDCKDKPIEAFIFFEYIDRDVV